MANMFRFELRRLLRKPRFYICLGLCVVYVILVLLSANASYHTFIGFSDKDYIRENFTNELSPEIFSLSVAGRALLPTFLAVFTGIFVTEDRVQGTIKNIYARGYSRTVVFFARYLTSTITAVIFFLANFLVSFCGSTVLCATSPLGIEPIHVNGFFLLVLGQFVSILAINTFYFMLSELVNHTGSAMSLNLFAPALVKGVLFILVEIFWLFSRSDYRYYSSFYKAVSYWLFDVVYSGFVPEMEVSEYIVNLAVSIGYILLFGVLSWLIINKKQVKG